MCLNLNISRSILRCLLNHSLLFLLNIASAHGGAHEDAAEEEGNDDDEAYDGELLFVVVT